MRTTSDGYYWHEETTTFPAVSVPSFLAYRHGCVGTANFYHTLTSRCPPKKRPHPCRQPASSLSGTHTDFLRARSRSTPSCWTSARSVVW